MHIYIYKVPFAYLLPSSTAELRESARFPAFTHGLSRQLNLALAHLEKLRAALDESIDLVWTEGSRQYRSRLDSQTCTKYVQIYASFVWSILLENDLHLVSGARVGISYLLSYKYDMQSPHEVRFALVIFGAKVAWVCSHTSSGSEQRSTKASIGHNSAVIGLTRGDYIVSILRGLRENMSYLDARASSTLAKQNGETSAHSIIACCFGHPFATREPYRHRGDTAAKKRYRGACLLVVSPEQRLRRRRSPNGEIHQGCFFVLAEPFADTPPAQDRGTGQGMCDHVCVSSFPAHSVAKKGE